VDGKYILAKFKGKKVAIVHYKTTYGQTLADNTMKTIAAGGMRNVLYAGVDGENDISALVSRIKVSGSDLVYWGGMHTGGALLIRRMRDQGVNVRMISGDGIRSDEFAAIAGPGVEGTLMTFGPDPRKNPAAAEVVKALAAKNIDPAGYVLYAYAAMQVVAAAAADAKSLDPKEVAATAKSGKAIKTVIGDLTYNEKGDITRLDYVMYVLRKGTDGKIMWPE
jgi:branched-chain amino acid transport system substrate-binding protein